MTLVDKVSGLLDRHLTRRSFVVRSAFAGSALAAGGTEFLLRPGTAYAQLCGYPSCGGTCDCDSTCCVDYTEFCCVLDGGYNSCPAGTIMGGWWLAEGSVYCDGPRYYMDCNGVCECDDGCGDFCDACDGLTCHCANDSCANYRTGCFAFRYGQCNQDVRCIGRIKCRVVTCVPPWEIEDCTTAVAVDDGAADQNAACVTSGPTYPPPPCNSPETRCEVVALAVSPSGAGYAMITSYGKILGYGNDPSGSVQDDISTPVADITTCPTGGRWVVTQPGRVIAQRGAGYYGDAENEVGSPVVGMAATPTGKGYWVVAARGRVINYGDAGAHGFPAASELGHDVVGMAATPTGGGYWVLTSAGGVFAYGDAKYEGDGYDLDLEDPFVGIEALGTGNGYWLVTSGGRVLPYGGAGSYGGTTKITLEKPIVAMARTLSGTGYWLVGADGGIYCFGNAVDHGAPVPKGT